jgi:hypothetical protein
MCTYRRIDGGRPIREALKESRMKLTEVAAATRERDPAGRGLSFQLIASLAADDSKNWSRETTAERSARLIEAALGAQEGALFAREPFSVLGGSTQ